MSKWRVFLESFLDGFGMGGFFGKLRQPGAATNICAPERKDEKE